jgi:hypothetical protein
MLKPSSPTDPLHPYYDHRGTCDRCHVCLGGECCEFDHPPVSADARDGNLVPAISQSALAETA